MLITSATLKMSSILQTNFEISILFVNSSFKEQLGNFFILILIREKFLPVVQIHEKIVTTREVG